MERAAQPSRVVSKGGKKNYRSRHMEGSQARRQGPPRLGAMIGGGRQEFEEASALDPMNVRESHALAKFESHAGNQHTQNLVGPPVNELNGSFDFDDDASSQGSYAGSIAGSVASRHSSGRFDDAEGGPHSIAGIRRLHGLRRDMASRHRKQRRAMKSFLTPIRIPGNRSVQAWVMAYGDDRSTFASKTRWAQAKLAEVQQLVEIGALPHSVLIAAAMQMLLELEDRLCFMAPESSSAISVLFRSLYHTSDLPGVSRGGLDPQLANLRRGTASDDYVQREHLLALIKRATFHELCANTETKLEYELSLRPGMEARLSARSRERRIERQIFAKISKRWACGVLWRIIEAWRSLLDEEKKRQRMGQVFVMMNGVKRNHVFKAWKRFTSTERWLRTKNSGEDTLRKMSKLKDAVKLCGIQTAELQKHESTLKEKVASLRKTLDKQLAVLHDPARQPHTLQGNLEAVVGLMKSNQECVCEQLKRSVIDIHRRGIDTARLAALYKWKGIRHIHAGTMDSMITKSRVVDSNSGEVRWDSIEDESDVDEDIEQDIHTWRPGTFKSTEKTPAFTPFNTRPGRRLLRWCNNTLRRAWIALNDDVPLALQPLELMRGAEDVSDVMKLRTIVSFLQVNRFHGGTVLDPRPSVDPRGKSGERTAEWLMEGALIGKSTQELARSVIVDAGKLSSSPGRYLLTKDITGEDDPRSAEEVEKERLRMERLKQRELDQGIIVHRMSQYMGQRVHVLDTRGPKLFAFISELFTNYFQGRKESAEEQHTTSQLHHTVERFEGAVLSCLKVVKAGPTSFSSKELLGKAEELRVMHHLGSTASRHLHSEWVDCLRDRDAYVENLLILLRTTWQSLCTTLLARKVRIEEDIDDGTFTTAHRVQLANEFKRLDIEDEEAQTAQCCEISTFLKTRIRDMKRIFSFYAASGDGPATSMDHSEFWRIIKDCKLQKDRKALPSVRVDLIFQQCNQDFSKEGKDRLESDDGELTPTEFIEGLIRLASYRFSKPLGSLAERFIRLVNEELLPKACSVDTDVFRERLASDSVQNVFAAHRRNLKVIYKEFAADDASDEGAMTADTMNAGELVSFCREVKLIGPLISEKGVRTIFAYVQQEEELLDEESNEQGDVGDSEMVFAEFNESQGAIAAFREPDPYNKLGMRVDKFFKEELIPAARNLGRFRGPKALK